MASKSVPPVTGFSVSMIAVYASVIGNTLYSIPRFSARTFASSTDSSGEKCEIYDLARYINSRFDNVIPEIILKKEPSSELRPNQKDSDILPPYEVVDAILYRMIEEGQHREEIVNAGFDAEVVEKIHSMVMTNVKKRYQYPPVLRLSTRSFRHECLFPLVNKYGY